MLIIGVDPGAGGAIAFLDSVTGELSVHDMPAVIVKRGARQVRQVSAALLASLFDLHAGAPMTAYIEQVGAMPHQGTVSTFAFGRAAGIVEGVLAGLWTPTTLVSPQVWLRGVGVASVGRHKKEASRARAAQLFPEYAGHFARAKDDGRAEAALIAWYGAQQNRNGGSHG